MVSLKNKVKIINLKSMGIERYWENSKGIEKLEICIVRKINNEIKNICRRVYDLKFEMLEIK